MVVASARQHALDLESSDIFQTGLLWARRGNAVLPIYLVGVAAYWGATALGPIELLLPLLFNALLMPR